VYKGHHEAVVQSSTLILLFGNLRENSICDTDEIKQQVLENWDLEMPVAALEMDINIKFRILFHVTSILKFWH